MANIEFRPCVPEDVEKAVPLILSSGPQAFNYVFANDRVKATDFLRYAFQRTGGEFSFDNHVALLLDQEVVGIGSAFTSKQANGFLFRDFLHIVRFYRMRALIVSIRGLRIEQLIKPPKRAEISIAHLGISPQHRSKGLGQQLIQFLMNHAPKESASYFVLDVSEENPRAQALYERMGFTVHKQMDSRLRQKHGYVANHVRMEWR